MEDSALDDKNLFLITGWQRSGTTLITRALNAHPNINAQSQPIFPFLQKSRDKVYREYIDSSFDSERPMSDEFNISREEKHRFINKLPDIYFSDQEIEKLRDELAQYNKGSLDHLSPKIIDQLDSLRGGKLREVLFSLFGIINKAYGVEEIKSVGAKELYSEKFIPVFLSKMKRDFRCIVVIRDPRATFASRNFGDYKREVGGQYSILFTVRNWRKSVAYSIKYHNRENCLTVKYEDFVRSPKKHLNKMSNFLGVDFSNKMLDVSNYKSGTGERWKPNSSFGKKEGISTSSIEKWKSKLNDRTVEVIEALCKPEMRYLGYQLTQSGKNFSYLLVNYDENLKEVRNYQKKYGYVLTDKTIKEEIFRKYLLDLPKDLPSEEVLNRFFIFQEVYKRFKQENR